MKVKLVNIAYYFLVVLVSVGLIYGVNNAPNEFLKVLLYFHARSVEVYYNLPMLYINGIGYTANDCTFTIGRECMGTNFIVLMFSMNACMFTSHFEGFGKLLWFLISLIGAAAAGFLINSFRIIASIPFVTHQKFVLLHSGLGISLYFAALAASYIFINTLIRRHGRENIY